MCPCGGIHNRSRTGPARHREHTPRVCWRARGWTQLASRRGGHVRYLRSIVVVMSLASLPIGLARPAFTAAGDLDTSFSGDGKLTTDFGSKQDFALGLALQADGKIVAAGVSAANGTNPKFALTRYNADGTLDTTFSGDGKVTTDFQSGNLDAANGVVAQ